LCSAKVLSQEDLKFVEPVLQGVKKALFISSNTIILQSMVKFFETFFTHYSNSLEQDPIVECQNKKIEKSIYASCSKNQSFSN
jgi:hypothetical protein